MEDRTFLTNNHPTDGVSDIFLEFIEALVEAEDLNYETIESNLTDLFEAVKELEGHESKSGERLIGFLAKDCYLSEDSVNKLIDHAAAVRTQKEVEKKAQEEREQKAREEAERKAREERDRIAKEKAQLQKKLDAERKAREETERKAREEAERKAKEEAERKAREEAQRKAELDAGDLSNFVYVENGMLDFKGEGFKEVQFPTQRVSVPSFHISKYLVTQEQWTQVMGAYSAKGSEYESHLGNRLPAIVKWDDAQAFILKLNQLTGRRYRIPFEAEWDFAAIGGRKTHNYKYSGSDDYDEIAWRLGRSTRILHEIGLKKPNELGLYDMCGNVREWCDTGWPPPYFRGILKGAAGYDYNDTSYQNGDGWKSIWARQLAIQNETMASFRLCY